MPWKLISIFTFAKSPQYSWFQITAQVIHTAEIPAY